MLKYQTFTRGNIFLFILVIHSILNEHFLMAYYNASRNI